MSRIQFDQLNVRARARVVSYDSALADYRAHRAMIKIIWSGFGGEHENAPDSDGRWDNADWQFLIKQFKSPATVRPIHGGSFKGQGYHQSSFNDDPRDRSQWYDYKNQRWITRSIAGKPRGAYKPRYQTIKAGHYSLLPPHGQMQYCRGMDPSSGLLATRTNPAHFDKSSFSFPGRQIGWLFSADPANGSQVRHCSPGDMYGRRVPHLGGASAVRYAMNNTVYRSSGQPPLMSIDELRKLHSAPRVDGKQLAHNDCRFKPTLAAAAAIVVPGGKSEGWLGILNGVEKKLLVLSELSVNLPLVDKASTAKEIGTYGLAVQWEALYRAKRLYPELLASMPTQLMEVDHSVLLHLKTLVPGSSDEQKEKNALDFVLSRYGLNVVVHYQLNNPCLMQEMWRYSDNRDAMYALLQCGASVDNPAVLKHVLEHWRDYRQVLDQQTQQRIIASILSEQLTDDLIFSGDTDFIKQLYALLDLPGWPPLMRKLVTDAHAGNAVSVFKTLYDADIGFSDAGRQRLYLQAFVAAVVKLDGDWLHRQLQEQQSREGCDEKTAFLALMQQTLTNIKQLHLTPANQDLFIAELQGQIVRRHIAAKDLQLLLFIPEIFQRLTAGFQQEVMDAVFIVVDGVPALEALNVTQQIALLNLLLPDGNPDYVTQVLLRDDFPLEVLDPATRAKVTQFVLSDGFSDLTAVSQGALFSQLLKSFELYVPHSDHAQFRVFCRRMVACDVSLLAHVIDYFIKPLQAHSIINRKPISVLTKLVEVLASLPSQREFTERGGVILSIEQYQQTEYLLQRCKQYKLSDGLQQALQHLTGVLARVQQENSCIQLGETEGEMLACLPRSVMNISRVDRDAHIAWRKSGYDYFKQAYAASGGHTEQASVKVYALDDMGSGVLLRGLDRSSGYRLENNLRSETKKRVICSSARLYKDEATILPVSIVSVVAPNLRKNTPGQYDSPSDARQFMTGKGLNQPAYYAAMYSAWALSFHALSQQAKGNDKRSIVVTPLLGGGAFLAGHPLKVRNVAIALNVIAMIKAYNAQPRPELPELHLCLPKMNASDPEGAFEYIQTILHELPPCKGRLVISQSDVFDLTYQTYAQDGFDADEYNVALVNPSSDHVPGGGCYAERKTSHFGRPSYSHRDAVATNRPGTFNPRPMALEEQLGQVTSFMYSQCASMNPEHLRFSVIERVKMSEEGSIVAAGDTLDKRVSEDRSVQHHLATKLPELYPMRYSTGAPDPRKPHKPPPRAPKRVQTAAAGAVVAPQLSKSAKVTAVSADVPKPETTTPLVYYRQFLFLLAELRSCYAGKSCGVLHRDKFKTFDKQLTALVSKSNGGVPLEEVPKYLTCLLLAAVCSHNGKLKHKFTSSGEAVVKALNSSYPLFSQEVHNKLGMGGDEHLRYQHIVQYAHHGHA
ncbi:MAG: hypothetical protein P1U63_12305 [Coxiellaceae bacterium]|nr:hypothetical protein [Coxiellaceae bacterium]